MKLKENLAHLMSQRRLSVSALARESGVAKQTIADWLNGSSPRDIRKLKQMADVFEATVDELCFGDVTGKQLEPTKTGDSKGWFGGLYEVRLRKVRR